jgi:hypothetical protein
MNSFLIVAFIGAALFAGSHAVWIWWSSRASSTARVRGEPIATRAVGDLTVSLYGDLHNGQTEVLVHFTDSRGFPTNFVTRIDRKSQVSDLGRRVDTQSG